MPSVGKGKDTEVGLYQDGSGTNKRGEAEWDYVNSSGFQNYMLFLNRIRFGFLFQFQKVFKEK